MDNETAFSIKKSLSKSSAKILLEIYRSPHIQHKALAAKMHTSSSSLCNILRRLEKISPSLIKAERHGRTKYYSLSETAAQYVEDQLLFSAISIQTTNASSQNNSGFNEALQILQQFQSAAGQSWHIILDDFLSGKGDQHSSLYILYMDFVNQMIQLTVDDKFDSIQEVYAALHQNILIERLKNCITAELEDYYALKPLFNLESQNPEYAILLIDYIFTRIRPDVFKGTDFPVSLRTIPLTQSAYQKICFKFREMINSFFNCQGKKTIALEQWKHDFLSCSFSLYYIAEKCHTIYWSTNPGL